MLKSKTCFIINSNDVEKLKNKNATVRLNTCNYFNIGSELVHRFVLDLKSRGDNDKTSVDHKNRLKWDNRSVNLRIATASEQCVNKRLKKCHYSFIDDVGLLSMPRYLNYDGTELQFSICGHPALVDKSKGRIKVGDKNKSLTIYGKFFRICQKLHTVNKLLINSPAYNEVDNKHNAVTAIDAVQNTILKYNLDINKEWYNDNILYVQENLDWYYATPYEETEIAILKCEEYLKKDQRIITNDEGIYLNVEGKLFRISTSIVVPIACYTWVLKDGIPYTTVDNNRNISLIEFIGGCQDNNYVGNTSKQLLTVTHARYAKITKDGKACLVDEKYKDDIDKLTWDSSGCTWRITLISNGRPNPNIVKHFPDVPTIIPKNKCTLPEFIYYYLGRQPYQPDTIVKPKNGIITDCRLHNLELFYGTRYKNITPAITNEGLILPLGCTIITEGSSQYVIYTSPLLEATIGKKQIASSRSSQVTFDEKVRDILNIIREVHIKNNILFDAIYGMHKELVASYMTFMNL
jgi:hypothetical protein